MMDIVVIGTSAGGVSALQTLLRSIPLDINAAVLIVQHTSPDGPGLLPAILQTATRLSVGHAREQESLERSRIYVAPPNHHLIVAEDQVLTTNGPKENHARPAIDPLFRSAALAYGRRVIGVILTGTLDDGTAGLWAVKDRGGIAIVQDPSDAEFPQMPHNALTHVHVDYCIPLAEIGPLVGKLASASRPRKGELPVPEELELETRIAKEEYVSKRDLLRIGEPTVFTCPECHGALLQMKRSGILSFRCHTGHAFSVQSLLSQLSTDIESNLWTAIRSMEESVLLLDHVSRHVQLSGQADLASSFARSARVTERQVALVRRVVMENEPLPVDGLEGGEKIANPNSSRPATTAE